MTCAETTPLAAAPVVALTRLLAGKLTCPIELRTLTTIASLALNCCVVANVVRVGSALMLTVEGALPAAGEACNHPALVVAVHAKGPAPLELIVRLCAAGFDPFVATKLRLEGVAANAAA